MKKNLIIATCLSCLFIACQEYEPFTKSDMFKDQFKTYIGGEIHPEQTWGFHNISIRKTRGLVPEIDDPFEEFGNIDALYVTEVPDGTPIADDNTPWYEYQNKSGDFELQNGVYEINCWNESTDNPRLNFYVTGDDVTIISNTIHTARIYVLPDATLNIGTGNAIHNFRIFVSGGGTLNFARSSISTQYCYALPGERTVAAIFNRGTLNFTAEESDNQGVNISTGAIVYNEGDMNVHNLDCAPEEGQNSYLYNYGNLNVSGDFKLESASNFYNEGKCEIAGDTEFTNDGIHWINKGHYYTENMNFSSQNSTTYNYCQLIVRDHFDWMDGEFNLMQGAYIEAGTAEFSNFTVHMWGHAGININNGSIFNENADGHAQGFIGDEWSYIRLGGTTEVADNPKCFQINGKIVYGIENLYDKSQENEGNEACYFDPESQEVPFESITAEESTEDCYVQWTPNLPDEEPEDDEVTVRVIVEDLPASINSLIIRESDFDYNDAVFDVTFREEKIEITVLACGGTLPLYVADTEVHGLFGLPTDYPLINKDYKMEPQTFTIDRNGITDANEITVEVEYEGERHAITAFQGEAPAKICVGADYVWCDEGEPIKDRYPKFPKWATDNDYTDNSWYK